LEALGLNEWVLFAPSTAEEKRVVIRDAQVERRCLEVRDSMSRANGGGVAPGIVREEREITQGGEGGRGTAWCSHISKKVGLLSCNILHLICDD